MTDKEKLTRDLIAQAEKAAVAGRKDLAAFLSRLDGLSRQGLLTYNQRINAIQNKVAILNADNCGACPGLPSPQAQQMQITTARNIINRWIVDARESLQDTEEESDLITKLSSHT